MRIREHKIGDKNIVGVKISEYRKKNGIKQKDLLVQLQIRGIDINASGLSKIEGQIRGVNDFELKAIAESLGVTVNWLLDIE